MASLPRPPYPKRPPFFANKFCRLTGKICLAQELGSEAVLLLMHVALVEDAKSYRSAVTFFNEQLMPLIGVNSHKALIRERTKAVNAGWLHYEPGGKGFAGRYWVTIPDESSAWTTARRTRTRPSTDRLPLTMHCRKGKRIVSAKSVKG
jgi:hypothetical protein